MKILTVKLQALVTKAIKGAGFNKLLPITNKIGIEVKNGIIRLCTSDGTNYLYVKEDYADESQSFSATVDADIFSKLILKTTSEGIELTIENNTLIVEGNGKYKIPLAMNDDGTVIVYPNMLDSVSAEEVLGTLSAQTIQLMISTIKPTLATNLSTPVYTNYLMSDYIVSTDRTMLNAYKNPNKFSEDKLLSREFVDLLGLTNADAVISEADNAIIAKSGNMTVYAKTALNISDFNKQGVNSMLDMSYDSYCKLKKSDLLPLIERISLFVGEYDESVVRLHFTEEGIEVTSKNDDGAELIEYMESKDFKDTSIKIDVNKLVTQLKSYQSDSIDLYYGNPSCIKFQDGDTVQITALFI